jgi:pseudaminic acid synthase
MNIDGRDIGGNLPPYIVAEVGANHCGSLDTALALIKAAKKAGADAVKFQCYTPDTITIDCDKPDFIIKDGPWKGRKLYELYAKAHTPFEWFPVLFEYARTVGITLFSSVFDETSVDLLESLRCPAYKIASMEITDTNLIRYAAKTGKPLIISTGMATDDEIHRALGAAAATRVLLLNCVSGYPSEVSEVDLKRLQSLNWFNTGISDHTLGVDIPIAATVLGAKVIEKHFILNFLPDAAGDLPEDADFSMDQQEFAAMVHAVNQVWQAMRPSRAKSEESSRQLRRSLYIVKDMKAGECFTRDNVRSIRPAYGMPPVMLEDVLHRIAARDIERGTALTADLLA